MLATTEINHSSLVRPKRTVNSLRFLTLLYAQDWIRTKTLIKLEEIHV